ncbi:Gfo/Idh/MocA family oxidoreductase [Microbacterium sp. ARD32]|uniref:Gfo/Idh/MocA family protein n=1 Tax=Microbacterium sp. ARD32 TaxID=2962577 RepID=UPI00288273DE|nr:Gfo/Idh/MocA family oxidoreductase [Microbacterium sp. ARD32]MDT0157662.1 Gfo/Idh/MocA family oxidoreductase [Microbacterium sp. ARD32]
MHFDSFAFGIIGAGTIANLHAEAIRAAGHRVARVCDVRPQAAERLAAEYGATAATDHRALLSDTTIDGVIITAPHALHAPLALDALAAGKHVLLEKPIATTHADAVMLAGAAATASVTLAVGHVLHFVPSHIAAHDLLRAGAIGDIRLVVERRASNYAEGSRPEWFFDPVVAGGGIVLNVGTHAIDRIQWFADARIRRVSGAVSARPGSEVETDAAALFELEGGGHASLTVTGTGLGFVEQIAVIGDRGALTVDREAGVQVFVGGERTVHVPVQPDEMAAAFTAQIHDVVEAARTGREPRVGVDYAAGVLDAALAVYSSSEIGASVTVTSEVAA